MTENDLYAGPPPTDILDELNIDTGDVVVFVLFGRRTLGVVTGSRDGRVLIDAGAGEYEIEPDKILFNAYNDSTATLC